MFNSQQHATPRRYLYTAVGVVVLAVVSLLSDAIGMYLNDGRHQILNFWHFFFSRIFNAGVLWAALSFYVGWLFKNGRLTNWYAPVIAILAMECTLIVHYGLGVLIGFMDNTIWSGNEQWFIAAVVLCGPIGWLGAIASRHDFFGYSARFTLPLIALVESMYKIYLELPCTMSCLDPDHISICIVSALLFVVGIYSTIMVIRSISRDRRTHS
ncbi:hypothetical protein EML15_08295 [Corynebacterium sp. sy017]|uniref:hypothetical protein n=1 Tax=unclassified Corynebacterium TaxID=2624378 RepID=UPI001185E1D5|nr:MULTISPECIES: hypothetical protein [unclassified Corynebacterium]MBP3089142.1 hypothetical protein [Corynebacterium sp. sy017]TSD91454.1 hypothetical protein ELY17_08305 [Corynebacterium sp. SY003]